MKKLYVPSPEQKESAKHGETLFPMQKYITKLDLVHPVVTTHWHEAVSYTHLPRLVAKTKTPSVAALGVF